MNRWTMKGNSLPSVCITLYANKYIFANQKLPDKLRPTCYIKENVYPEGIVTCNLEDMLSLWFIIFIINGWR